MFVMASTLFIRLISTAAAQEPAASQPTPAIEAKTDTADDDSLLVLAERKFF